MYKGLSGKDTVFIDVKIFMHKNTKKAHFLCGVFSVTRHLVLKWPHMQTLCQTLLTLEYKVDEPFCTVPVKADKVAVFT